MLKRVPRAHSRCSLNAHSMISSSRPAAMANDVGSLKGDLGQGSENGNEGADSGLILIKLLEP